MTRESTSQPFRSVPLRRCWTVGTSGSEFSGDTGAHWKAARAINLNAVSVLDVFRCVLGCSRRKDDGGCGRRLPRSETKRRKRRLFFRRRNEVEPSGGAARRISFSCSVDGESYGVRNQDSYGCRKPRGNRVSGVVERHSCTMKMPHLRRTHDSSRRHV